MESLIDKLAGFGPVWIIAGLFAVSARKEIIAFLTGRGESGKMMAALDKLQSEMHHSNEAITAQTVQFEVNNDLYKVLDKHVQGIERNTARLEQIQHAIETIRDETLRSKR